MTQEKLLRFSHQDMQLHAKKTKYQGFFKLEEYQVSHTHYDGTKSDVLSREVFERGDAVVLLPYDPIQDNVVLIEQFRPGAIRAGKSPWLLEFIAGMFKEDEKPAEVAIREAQEEANLVIEISNVHKIMNYLSSPGGMSESIHLYWANIDSTLANGVHGLPEEGEDILVHVLKRTEALALLAQGKIVNAATVIGLQWLAMNYKHCQTLKP